jgi:hypothetical protein
MQLFEAYFPNERKTLQEKLLLTVKSTNCLYLLLRWLIVKRKETTKESMVNMVSISCLNAYYKQPTFLK